MGLAGCSRLESKVEETQFLEPTKPPVTQEYNVPTPTVKTEPTPLPGPAATIEPPVNIEPTLTPTIIPTPEATIEDLLNIFRTSNTGNPNAIVRFSEDYRELPYKDVVVDPAMIILHWDGQPGQPSAWNRNVTFNGLSGVRERYELLDNGMIQSEIRASNSHFGVDKEGITQYLPMFEDYVQHSFGAFGYYDAINIEMSGSYFTYEDGKTNVPEQEVENALDLVVKLMLQYNIQYEDVVGHYERDTYIDSEGVEHHNGKPDPGPEFLGYFKEELKERLNLFGFDLGQPGVDEILI